MPVVIAFVSQKGGVGKSTLARALATVAVHAGIKVRIADLDPQQQTVVDWSHVRAKNGVTPPVDVRLYTTAQRAIDDAGNIDLLVVDGPGRTSVGTLEIARRATLLVQPSGASADDLRPAVLLFHELVKGRIDKRRLFAALCGILNEKEEAAARAYIKAAGYQVLRGSLMEKAAYREAQNRGMAITETKYGPLNKQADALVEELLKLVFVELKAQQNRRQDKLA